MRSGLAQHPGACMDFTLATVGYAPVWASFPLTSDYGAPCHRSVTLSDDEAREVDVDVERKVMLYLFALKNFRQYSV
jgi:hypothetical protein